jgi:hypothetical protein
MFPREPASSVRHIRVYDGAFHRAAQAARMLDVRLRVVPTARSALDDTTFAPACRKPSLTVSEHAGVCVGGLHLDSTLHAGNSVFAGDGDARSFAPKCATFGE